MLDQSGANTPSNDDLAEWMRQVRTQKRKCDEENGVLRNIYKRAKAEGANVKAMRAAIAATKLDPDEVKQNHRDQIRYEGILHIELHQSDIFTDFDLSVTEKTAHQDDMWDAEDKGYRAGRHGVKVEDCPYLAGTELHVRWLSEWNKGQAAIARELGPNVKMADPSRKRAAGRPGRQSSMAVDSKKTPPPYVPGAVRRGRRKANGGAVAAN